MNVTQFAGFADIHTHILPGVDDGAPDMTTAKKLVQMAWDNGTRVIFLTPHFRGAYRKHSPSDLQGIYATFSREIKREFPGLQLYFGCEIHFQADVPELLNDGKLLPLANSQYVLLEFRSNSLRSNVLSAVYETIRNGFTPIIAHVERYAAFYSDLSLAEEVLDLGALIQLNADSVIGKHGFRIKHFCHKLLKAHYVHFIASDAHDSFQRPPLLKECFLHVCKKYGEDYANHIFYSNAQAIIENRMI